MDTLLKVSMKLPEDTPESSVMHFVPDPKDTKSLRDAFGQFATGVTVITCCIDGQPVGITANSFTSVSLDPALVLWCLSRDSDRCDSFMQARHFAIHIMPHYSEKLCLEFAQSGDVFQRVSWESSPSGVPLLQEYIGRLECTTHAMHEGGDHTIIIGHVERISQHQDTPLVFAQGSFHQLG